jgi:hypothetical protein
MLTTPQADNTFDRLAARLREIGCPIEPKKVPLTSGTVEQAYQAVRQIYSVEAAQAGLRAEQIVADFTGGLKTLTAGMVLACLPYGWPLEYLVSDFDRDGNLILDTRRVIRVDVSFARAK